MIIDYIIVTGIIDDNDGHISEHLETKVRRKLSEGFIPYGSPFIDCKNNAFGYQAMIKEGRAEEIKDIY